MVCLLRVKLLFSGTSDEIILRSFATLPLGKVFDILKRAVSFKDCLGDLSEWRKSVAEKTHLNLSFWSILFPYSPGFALCIWNYDFHHPLGCSSLYSYFTSSAAGYVLECLDLLCTKWYISYHCCLSRTTSFAFEEVSCICLCLINIKHWKVFDEIKS